MSGCDYCDEGLPLDGEGWHLRVDPDDFEPTQRIPCEKTVAPGGIPMPAGSPPTSTGASDVAASVGAGAAALSIAADAETVEATITASIWVSLEERMVARAALARLTAAAERAEMINEHFHMELQRADAAEFRLADVEREREAVSSLIYAVERQCDKGNLDMGLEDAVDEYRQRLAALSSEEPA